MPTDFSETLVIGISSRSLFDLEKENTIFNDNGLEAYRSYQIDHENNPPPKGTAFPLVKAMLDLNKFREEGQPPLVEVILLSRNDAGIGLRIFNAINHHGLEGRLTRAVFTSGVSLSNYLEAFQVDLFLSKNQEDVQEAVSSNTAAALIQDPPEGFYPDKDIIRIALDGDAVIFSDESEKVYKSQGLEAFIAHEQKKAKDLLPEGPFGKFLKMLSKMHGRFKPEERPVRLALVTARSAPAHERVIRTLRAWKVDIDEAFFMGGLPKGPVLKAFRAHIFFDDQSTHVDPAAKLVPSGHVMNKPTNNNTEE
jgi:5'-nucleotidase